MPGAPTPSASGRSTASASRRSATSSPTARTARSPSSSGAGWLDAVITQNIDLLHGKAGTRELVEVHGSIAACVCLACGARYGLAAVLERLGEATVPLCDCGRPLKPDVVLFGEFLPEAALERAAALAEAADLLLCIGSSLEVYPVAQLPALTLRRGGAIAMITQGPTPYDGRATVRLGGDVERELEALVAAL